MGAHGSANMGCLTERGRTLQEGATPHLGSVGPRGPEAFRFMQPTGAIVVRGARTHNLKNVDVTLPAGRADRHHRRERLGQVVARLRHRLRRRPAPLRRVAVGVCAAVSRADGEARRRSHRRHLPVDRDPAEEQRPQSALDRRDRHRDSRLHAAAVRARRPHVLPAVRTGSGPRDRRGRRRRSSCSCRRARGSSSASTLPLVAMATRMPRETPSPTERDRERRSEDR